MIEYRIHPIEERNKSRFESYLGWNKSWWSYYRQFKNAAHLMVREVEENRLPIDTISLPMLFAIRHCIEVGLKANILALEPLNESIARIDIGGRKSHSIRHLSQVFEQHLILLIEQQTISEPTAMAVKGYLATFAGLQSVLSRLDDSSTNFRYPVDTKLTPVFHPMQRENLSGIVDAFAQAQAFIEFTLQVLSDEGVFREED